MSVSIYDFLNIFIRHVFCVDYFQSWVIKCEMNNYGLSYSASKFFIILQTFIFFYLPVYTNYKF